MSSSNIPRGQKIFAQSFLIVYISHSLSRYSIQESRMSSKITWKTFWRSQGEYSSNAPRGLKFCTELPSCLYMSFLMSIVIYTPFRNQEYPKSSTDNSGIKNFLQYSLKEALETHWSISSSSAARGLKLCRDLPQYLYFPFLTSLGIKPCLRNQESPWRKLWRLKG